MSKKTTATQGTTSDHPVVDPTLPTTAGEMPEPPEAEPVQDPALTAAYGDTRPTMVNGQYVGDKQFNVQTGEWEALPADPEADPEAEA